MDLVSSFVILLQPLAYGMTTPSFGSFVTIVTGWIFAPRRTVSNMLLAASAVGKKHHSSFYRFFSQARWSSDQVGLLLFRLLPLWPGEETIFLAVDDTLARKRGLKVFGAGMHHDPLLSSRNKAIVNWAHSWVVLGVVIRFPLWPERVFCLPILFSFVSQPVGSRAGRTPLSYASGVGRGDAGVAVWVAKRPAFSPVGRQRLWRTKCTQPIAVQL